MSEKTAFAAVWRHAREDRTRMVRLLVILLVAVMCAAGVIAEVVVLA